METGTGNDGAALDSAQELCAGLVRRSAVLLGSSEKLATAIPGLFLVRRTAPTSPSPVTYEPSIALVVQGSKRVELGQQSFTYDAGKFLLTSLDLPVMSRVVEASPAKPYFCLLSKFEMPLVREVLSREEALLPPARAATLAMATAETTPELLDAFRRLLGLLETPPDIPFLGGIIQREIIYRVLQTAAGARLRAIASSGEHSHRVAKAAAWVKANYAKPLRVEKLAELAAMGRSTFHHHFHALTGMSPLQYQKQLRLQAARQRMLIEGLDASSAAFEVGYESASQFNREYRRFFGQPPLRDVRILRSQSAPRETAAGAA